MANFPGVPAVVTPSDAEWLERNHPRYDEYKGVIQARLEIWRADNDPTFKLKTSSDKKRHERVRLVAAGALPVSALDEDEDGTSEIASEPQVVVEEPVFVVPAAGPVVGGEETGEEGEGGSKEGKSNKSAGGKK